jgi:hypothetical protein
MRFSTAGLLLLLAGCSPYPPGWTVHKHYSHNRVVGEHAAPDGGRWLGFRLGMTAKDASAALCRSVLDGDIAAGDAPVRVTDGRCVVIPDTRVAAGNWLITMPSLGCLPFSTHQEVQLDFGWPNEIRDGSQLWDIRRACPRVYFP